MSSSLTSRLTLELEIELLELELLELELVRLSSVFTVYSPLISRFADEPELDLELNELELLELNLVRLSSVFTVYSPLISRFSDVLRLGGVLDRDLLSLRARGGFRCLSYSSDSSSKPLIFSLPHLISLKLLSCIFSKLAY